ncbi:hypothetical protein CDL15_Pgr000775 [Punica granatum]|uniref:Uncharacterized protein n=1 Tax=Punica granatum TaxID=22663 RepID=A0A218W452_PUNGR|nr:hypothetical protein CDL15_Pgr000775 [Punica granatum]
MLALASQGIPPPVTLSPPQHEIWPPGEVSQELGGRGWLTGDGSRKWLRCAAHIDCVVIPKVEPEQRKLLEDLMLVKLDEEIASVEVETEALKKKTEMSMKNLEELKKKRQEIMSSRMQEEAKLKWA